MTQDEFYDYIRTRLGYPEIEVELTRQQVLLCAGDALRNFNQVLCHHVPKLATEQYGSVVITLTDGCRGVIECMALFPESQMAYANMNVFEIMYRMVFPRLPIGEWYQLRSFYEMYQRIRGTEPDWKVFRAADGTVKLFIDCWSGPYDIWYVEIQPLTFATVQTVTGEYFQQYIDLTFAKAQRVLARIRGKYNGIPAPGGTINTDARDLEQQGRETEEKVLKWLNNTGKFFAMPIVVG